MKELLTICAIVIVYVFIAEEITAYDCRTYSEITGKETTRKFLSGCYVKTDNGFVIWEEYISRSVASEGLGKVNP